MMREICAVINSKMKKTVPNGGDGISPAGATNTTPHVSSPQSVQARPSVIIFNEINLTANEDPDRHARDSASNRCAERATMTTNKIGRRCTRTRQVKARKSSAPSSDIVILIDDETDSECEMTAFIAPIDETKKTPNHMPDGSCVPTPMVPHTEQDSADPEP